MNREEYISILELDIAELKKEKENLIKYLENEIKINEQLIDCVDSANRLFFAGIAAIKILQDILERVKSGKYDRN